MQSLGGFDFKELLEITKIVIMLGIAEIVFVVVLWFLAFKYINHNARLPPGPNGYPIIGNMLDMAGKPQLKLSQWAKEYGELYTIRLGFRIGIVVNDLKLLKEMLSDSNYTGKPDIPLFESINGGKYGIINSTGAHWEEQRRWVLRKLRDYGFGKTSMEGMIMDEVHEAVAHFEKNIDKPIEINDRFNIAVLNSIWTILTGTRLSQEDPKLKFILDAFNEAVPLVNGSGLAFFPWLRFVMPGVWKKIQEISASFLKYVRDAVGDHVDTYNDGLIRDFVDEYISEMKKTEDPSSSFYKEVGRKNLEGVVSDFIQAGSITSSTTIQWIIEYLTHRPKVQQKLQEELDSVLGHSREVTLQDKPNLPYMEAVILETLRMSSISATGVIHAANENATIYRFKIPKGAWIFPNLYHIHHDPKIWGDPEVFRPERFLSPDGTKTIRPEHLIPFQIGRRVCLGETLAKDTIFLFAATIFQRFTISKLGNAPPEPQDGLFLLPKSNYFIFKRRE